MKSIFKPVLAILSILAIITVGCKKEDTVTPIDPKKLTANFSFTGDNVQGPCTVNFTNLSTNFDSCIWYFGTGDTSHKKDRDIIHHSYPSYDKDTSYSVKLVVYGKAGDSTSFTKSVKVLSTPTPTNVEFTASAGKKIGEVVTFTADPNITNAAKYIWDFNDGAKDSTSGATVNHIYADGGTYSVKLTVRSSAGIEKSIPHFVKIWFPDPVAKIIIPAGPYSVIKEIQFDADATNVDTWAWYFDDTPGTTYEKTPKHRFKTPGMHAITLIVRNKDGIPKDTVININVEAAKQVTITKVTITQMPPNNPLYNGVFFSIGTDPNSITVFKTTNIFWIATNKILSADFATSKPFTLFEHSTIGTPSDHSLGTIDFKMNNYVGDFPSFIDIQNPGGTLKVRFDLKWE